MANRPFAHLILWAALLLAPGSLMAQAKPAATISNEELAAVQKAEAARIAAIERIYGSVVAIYGNDRQGGGSGVLYHRQGYALTNHHVVAGAGDEGWAGLADGKLYRWKLLGTDPGGDVAIIRLLGRDDFPPAPLGDSETVRVGDWAMAVGNPFVLAEDQRPTVTLGIVSGVHRYQPGDGLNTLVYGNCIQVDSSINPGNSGGPLFNLHGEVIGINGRGSFEERGRVNVGLGYAISSNQVKHFIPDLLATKTVQHGTLDCQFGNRAGGVICQTINLNAPIARLGMELGDKLISFEGIEIKSANQFTNIVSTLPAEWPCEVTFEHAAQRKTVFVRLTPLPYDLGQQQPMDEKPMEEKPGDAPPKSDEEKPAEKKADEAKPAEEKPAEKQPAEKQPAAEKPAEKKPAPKNARPKPKRMPLEAGKIRSPELNRESTQLLLQQWQAAAIQQAPAGLLVRESLWEGEKIVGEVEFTLASDQRFAVRVKRQDQPPTAIGFNGATFWKQNEEEKIADLSFTKAMRDPLAVHALALAAMLRGTPHDAWGPIALEIGDKAQRQIAYRLAIGPAEQDPVYLWLSVFDATGKPGVSLLKSGIGLHDDEPIPAIAYYDWKSVQGLSWPHRKVLVRGLAEIAGAELRTRSVEAITPTDAQFKME